MSAEHLDVTTSKIAERGCPQGGILSPVLWNLVMEGALEAAREIPGVEVFRYADDLCVAITGICPETLRDIMQQCLSRLQVWANINSLSFSPHKTEVIMFTRKRKWVNPVLTLNGIQLRVTTEVKYLGVILDQKLSWIPHCQYITKRAILALGQCRRIVGSTWGLKPAQMYWLYTTVIRPIVAYASVVWSGVVDSTRASTLLNKTQRMACLSITSAYRTTPTAALEALTGLKPLPLFLRTEATAAAYRLRALKRWKAKRNYVTDRLCHWYKPEETIRKITELQLPTDRGKTKFLSGRKFEVRIPNNKEEALAQHLVDRELGPEDIQCYTDGSRMRGRTGAGYIVTSPSGTDTCSIPLGTFPTVYQSETVAIAETAKSLLRRGIENKSISFFSDCRSTLFSLRNQKTKSKLIEDCFVSLNELTNNNAVCLAWIPGDWGIAGNSAADTCARLATSMDYVGPEPAVALPADEGRKSLKRWADREHQQIWQSTTGCRQTKEARPMICKDFAKALLRMSRSNVRNIVQVITGHANLGRHRFITKQRRDPFCKKCNSGEEETPWHHVAICPFYRIERALHMAWVRPMTWENLTENHLQDLVAFLKETKRLEEHDNML